MTGPPMNASVEAEDCKWMGHLCSETPNCGWDDPDSKVRIPCQHEGPVCREDGHGQRRCMTGPPMNASEEAEDCKWMGHLCSETPNCGWDDPDSKVRIPCQHEGPVCRED